MAESQSARDHSNSASPEAQRSSRRQRKSTIKARDNIKAQTQLRFGSEAEDSQSGNSVEGSEHEGGEIEDVEDDDDFDKGKDGDFTSHTPTKRSRRKPAGSNHFSGNATQRVPYMDLESVEETIPTYVGPTVGSLRGRAYMRHLFAYNDRSGPRIGKPGAEGSYPERISEMWDWVLDWIEWPYLPLRGIVDGGIWMHQGGHLRTKGTSTDDKNAQETIPVPEEERGLYTMPGIEMPIIIGPLEEEQEVKLSPGKGVVLSQFGLPFDEAEDNTPPLGWMIDTGGIVLSMDWQPLRLEASESQILALAVIPHADQEVYDYEAESVKPEFEKYGVVQFWEFWGEVGKTGGGIFASKKPARLRKHLCSDSGRVPRLKWCPDGGKLALVCGDGSVLVVRVKELDDILFGKSSFHSASPKSSPNVFQKKLTNLLQPSQLMSMALRLRVLPGSPQTVSPLATLTALLPSGPYHPQSCSPDIPFITVPSSI